MLGDTQVQVFEECGLSDQLLKNKVSEQRIKLMELYGNALGKAYEIDDNLTVVANYLEFAVDRLVEIDDFMCKFMGDDTPGGWIPGTADPILGGYFLGFYDRIRRCEVVYFDISGGWTTKPGGFGTPDFWRELPAYPKRL